MFFESFWLNSIVAIGLILTLTFDYVTKFFRYWYVRHIPYKTSIPFFGGDYHRVLGLRNTTEEVNALYEQHPKEDFVGSVKSRIPDLIVKTPDLIKEVLCTEFESFKSRGLDLDKSRDICLRNNLFYAEGEKWTLLRECLESLLNDVTVSEDCVLGSLLGTNGNMNVQHLLTKVLDDVYKNLLLTEYNGSIITELRTVFQRRNLSDKFFNYMKNIFPSVYVSFGLSTLLKPSKKTIDEINQSKFSKKLKSILNSDGQDFTRLLKSTDEDVTFGILSSIVSEGYIPTLNLLTALTFELAINPEIQNQSRGSKDEYLDAIIKETLRLHPVFSVITRKCVKTYKFSQSKVLVDRKVTLNIPVEAIHLDELHYKDAKTFKPERFLKEGATHGYAYMPFGAGPRKCIGEQLSLQIVRSIAKALIQKFQIKATDKTPRHLSKIDHNFQRVIDTHLWLNFTPIKENSI